MDVYPIFLTELAQQRCVVIGGGYGAERKVQGLLDSNATVTIISADLTDQLHVWAHQGAVTWLPRTYRLGDLRGAFLVIATEGDAQINARIRQEARTERALINIVDDAARSTFIAGSVMRQGPLTIAVSTSGCSPALAVRLRQQFEQEFGPEYAAFLTLLKELRGPLAARYPDFQERRARWYALIDSDILVLLRAGQSEAACQRVASILTDSA